MTKTVEQLQRELDQLTGERNAWREMAMNAMSRLQQNQPFVVPQIQPLKVEPVVIPMYPHWASPAVPNYPSYPWWQTTTSNKTEGISFNLDTTTDCEISVHSPYVTVEELRAHLDNHN